jgi:hypothetical protein
MEAIPLAPALAEPSALLNAFVVKSYKHKTHGSRMPISEKNRPDFTASCAFQNHARIISYCKYEFILQNFLTQAMAQQTPLR